MGYALKGCLGCLDLFILLPLVVGGCIAYFSAKEYDEPEESVTEKVEEATPNNG